MLAFVVETLSQLGVPAKILVWLVAGFALAIPAGVAIADAHHLAWRVRARRPQRGARRKCGRFGDRASSAASSRIAIAAALFRSEGQMSALALGLCGGCVVGGILIAPYFRRSGSATPGDFLSARFGSRLLERIGRPDHRRRAVSDAGRPALRSLP